MIILCILYRSYYLSQIRFKTNTLIPLFFQDRTVFGLTYQSPENGLSISGVLQSRLHIIYLFLSYSGLALLVFNVFNGIDLANKTSSPHQLSGIVYLMICVLGVIASFSPNVFSVTHSNRKNSDDSATSVQMPKIKGHHPDCGHFTGHTLNIHDKWYCAGCSGLGLGGVIAVIISGSYFFLGLSLVNPLSLFWTGVFFVVVGLGQHYIDGGNPVVHFLLNVVFVMGATLLIISVDNLRSSFQLDTYLIVLILFWIMTRIQVSKTFHSRICENCDIGCRVSFKG
jgi:hypothetical protein